MESFDAGERGVLRRLAEGSGQMKVLLVADEFFSWGQHGGFGAFTRKLGAELVKHGVAVDAYVQKISSYQADVGDTETIDGVTVKTLPRGKLAKFRSEKLYRTDADVIHSQCGRLDTRLTFSANPSKKKAVTIQDLRTKTDLAQLKCENKGFVKRVWSKYVDILFRDCLREADAVCCQAELLKPKIQEVYGLDCNSVTVMPNFVDVPDQMDLVKADRPTVVWLGRLDPIKRPEVMFEVARSMPDVEFYVLGEASDPVRQRQFESETVSAQSKGLLRNVHLMGFQSGYLKENMLSKAWILLNTSIYECLPVSFLEACAHKCALLSTQNPDGFTVNFGYYAISEKDLIQGLKRLLYADNWRHLGSKAYDHVKRNHSTQIGVQKHLDLYRSLTD